MTKWHISPKTKTPQICNAQEGNCPYEHFDSWEQAQQSAEGYLHSVYSHKGVFGNAVPDDPYAYLLDVYSPEGLMKFLRTTDNDTILTDVIEMKTSLSYNKDYLFSALRNEHINEPTRFKLHKFIGTIYSDNAIVTFMTGEGFHYLHNQERGRIRWDEEQQKYLFPAKTFLDNLAIDKRYDAIRGCLEYGRFTDEEFDVLINKVFIKQIDKPPYSSILLNVGCPKEIKDKIIDEFGEENIRTHKFESDEDFAYLRRRAVEIVKEREKQREEEAKE